MAGPGAGQGRTGQGVSRLYYTVKNTAHWFCGHEVSTKGVGRVPTGNSRLRRNIRQWRCWEQSEEVSQMDAFMDLNDGPCSAQLWLQRHSQLRLQWLARGRVHPGSLPSYTLRRLAGKLGPLSPGAQDRLQPC